jgi:hypothetical protein
MCRETSSLIKTGHVKTARENLHTFMTAFVTSLAMTEVDSNR